jgi:hypothetical protein
VTCPVCRERILDRRKHRHANPEIRAAEEYGRLKAEQERELLRGYRSRQK